MKRNTENISNRNLKSLIKSKRNSVAATLLPQQKPAHAFINKYPFTCSLNTVGNIVEEVVDKVNCTIRMIEEKKYQENLITKIKVFSENLITTNNPRIDDLDSIIQPEQEPCTIQNDQICLKECVIERKKKHQKTCSNISSPSKK